MISIKISNLLMIGLFKIDEEYVKIKFMNSKALEKNYILLKN